MKVGFSIQFYLGKRNKNERKHISWEWGFTRGIALLVNSIFLKGIGSIYLLNLQLKLSAHGSVLAFSETSKEF